MRSWRGNYSNPVHPRLRPLGLNCDTCLTFYRQTPFVLLGSQMLDRPQYILQVVHVEFGACLFTGGFAEIGQAELPTPLPHDSDPAYLYSASSESKGT